MAGIHGIDDSHGDEKRIKHVLITGAAGFLGAHIVDVLLEKGYKVRAATRSKDRGQQLLDARPQTRDTGKFEIVRIDDFIGAEGDESDFGVKEAMKGIDAVI